MQVVLTPIEFQVLVRLYNGLTSNEISTALNLRISYVQRLKTKIFTKLGIKTRYEVPRRLQEIQITIGKIG